MKKLLISVCALGFALCSNAQAVVDNAVIPVSVNINSIMRMNVVSGGNIEFSFNNIDQYTNGIANTDRYDTKFTVASSVDFQVKLSTESEYLLGADNTANQMGADLIGLLLENSGSVTPTSGYSAAYTNLATFGTAGNVLLKSKGGNSAANAYIINWSCGVEDEGAAATILESNLKPDRYSTNVFLVLSAQ